MSVFELAFPIVADADAGMLVVPVPLSVPPFQSRTLTSKTAVPLTVPPSTHRFGIVSAALTVSVPEVTCSTPGPPTLLPPASVTVLELTRNVEPAAIVMMPLFVTSATSSVPVCTLIVPLFVIVTFESEVVPPSVPVFLNVPLLTIAPAAPPSLIGASPMMSKMPALLMLPPLSSCSAPVPPRLNVPLPWICSVRVLSAFEPALPARSVAPPGTIVVPLPLIVPPSHCQVLPETPVIVPAPPSVPPCR